MIEINKRFVKEIEEKRLKKYIILKSVVSFNMIIRS